jgi:hypothetical protein
MCSARHDVDTSHKLCAVSEIIAIVRDPGTPQIDTSPDVREGNSR